MTSSGAHRRPIEPPPSEWDLDALAQRDAAADLVAMGMDLEPGTLLAAYRHAMFPMPIGRRLGWFSPLLRGVLPLDEMRVSRSLQKSARGFETTVDHAFLEVIDGCADPNREHGWITNDIRDAYHSLHELGWAHSVETWRDGELVGGLYGVSIAGLFAGESMFHRATDASKVALMRLVQIMTEDEQPRLLDMQWLTPHLTSLGGIEVSRAQYVTLLRDALTATIPSSFTG